MCQIGAGCQKFHWTEKKKAPHFPAISNLHFSWKCSWVCWELLIRGWRAWNPVLVNTHPPLFFTLKWDFPLDQREGGTEEGEEHVKMYSRGDFTMGTTGPAHSDRISIISINPLYFSHHKGTTIVLTVPKRKMLMFDLAGEVPMTHSSGGIQDAGRC